MKIDEVRVYGVALPFVSRFSHARSTGDSARNIIVEIIGEGGAIRGYGEGAPRAYVTGETQQSAARFACRFASGDAFPWDLNHISQIWGFVDTLPAYKEFNAAICATEMSLLDALGKYQNQYITGYFPSDFYTDTVYYGASIPIAPQEKIIQISKLIGQMGIKHVRIKMDEDLQQNRLRMDSIRSVLSPECEFRVDPNGVWDMELAMRHLPMLEAHRVKVLEEPFADDSPGFKEFAEATRSRGIVLMACQSAPTLEHVKRIVGNGHYEMVNVKLSRSGGFKRSFQIIHFLRNRGLAYQTGCNLGESGLLSAAGRALALLCKDAVYHDGSYDRFILKENLTVTDVSFGMGGQAGPLRMAGLGAPLSKDALKRMCNLETLSVCRPKQP
jgi:muconate cycloisomerase